MSTSIDFITYVCDQIQDTGNISYKKLFGEYMVYVNNKPILLVCNNCIYVKMYPELKDILKDCPRGIPFYWAIEDYMLDVDDRELLIRVVNLLEPIIVVPYKKHKREVN
ncbi:MAG: hypothetical protein RR624_08760 [Longicatena sp.]